MKKELKILLNKDTGEIHFEWIYLEESTIELYENLSKDGIEIPVRFCG